MLNRTLIIALIVICSSFAVLSFASMSGMEHGPSHECPFAPVMGTTTCDGSTKASTSAGAHVSTVTSLTTGAFTPFATTILAILAIVAIIRVPYLGAARGPVRSYPPVFVPSPLRVLVRITAFHNKLDVPSVPHGVRGTA